MKKGVAAYRLMGQLRRSEAGAALVEAAFIMPIIVGMVFGGLEIGRYVFDIQRAGRVAMSTADLISRNDEISTTQLSSLLDAANEIVGSESFSTKARVIVSYVRRTGSSAPTIEWQETRGPDGLGEPLVGSVGATATLPETVTLDEDEAVVVSEIYHPYSPLVFDSLLGDRTIYRVAYFRPRYGRLVLTTE
ncbi:MAG: TadE/TadG family type IV pilus assembly protein [Pseudomonadota bacterium]